MSKKNHDHGDHDHGHDHGEIENHRVLKNVTIRGVDSDVYENFSHRVKMINMTIGDAITKMMKDITVDLDESFADFNLRSPLSSKLLVGIDKVSISHHGRLEINAQDLVDAKALISFSHIGTLRIGSDVTEELFMRHIRNISHCETVKLPNILPKLLLLSKISYCERIEVYMVDSSGNLEEILE